MDVGGGGLGSCRQRVQEGKPRGGWGGVETEVREREKERAEGWSEGRERWRVCPGDARLVRRRGTGYSPGRERLFYMSAPADSCGQEFRSSFCHPAYARSSVTKTCQSPAAAGHKRSSAQTLPPLC